MPRNPCLWHTRMLDCHLGVLAASRSLPWVLCLHSELPCRGRIASISRALHTWTYATHGLGSVLSWVTQDFLVGSVLFSWQLLPFPGRSSCNISIQFIMSRRTLWLMPLCWHWGWWILACCPAERAPCHCDRWPHVLACCTINRSSKYESGSLERDFESHIDR